MKHYLVSLPDDAPGLNLPPGSRVAAVPASADLGDAILVETCPDRIRLRVGTLEADLSAAFIGSVKLDGYSIPTRRLVIDGEVGQLVKVNLEVVPISILAPRIPGAPKSARRQAKLVGGPLDGQTFVP